MIQREPTQAERKEEAAVRCHDSSLIKPTAVHGGALNVSKAHTQQATVKRRLSHPQQLGRYPGCQ